MFNWDDQWALNAPIFENGKAIILLRETSFELLPGPGFGDCSHPTTQLMLDMMDDFVAGKTIFDIGCGSGILTVAAHKLGAKELFCTDCDPDAIAHTQKNGLHNGIWVDFNCPKKCDVVLMNMIESEQKVAWSAHSVFCHTLLTSGILLADQKRYLDWTLTQGWSLLSQFEKEGWSSFIFTQKGNRNES